jgi:ribosomal protein L11
MDFCKQSHAATENQRGTIIPVEITIYEDRTFTFVLKTPPTAVLLREAAGLEKGAAVTGREQVGTISDAQLTAIDRNRRDEDAGPQRQRHRCRQAAGRGHSALDGHRSRSLSRLRDEERREPGNGT